MNIIIRKIVVFEDENECFVIFFTRRLFLNNYINYIFDALNEFGIQRRKNKEVRVNDLLEFASYSWIYSEF